MEVTIRNQARYLLICTLNSGRTIHLAPSETSQPLQHLEINGNEKIDKLVRTGLVSIASEVEGEKENEAAEAKEDGTEEKTAAPAGRRQRKDKE